MKDAPEVSWHVKFDSQNLKHSGDLARWSTIAHRPSPIAAHESSIEPKHNLATLGIIDQLVLDFGFARFRINAIRINEGPLYQESMLCHNVQDMTFE